MSLFRSGLLLVAIGCASCTVAEQGEQQVEVVIEKRALEAGASLNPSVRLSLVVRKAGRALTLQLAGLEWVRPNDHVDIIATLKDPATEQLATVTLLQNVIVLTVGSHTGESALVEPDFGDPLAGKATLMLLPEEIEQLVMADKIGSLFVSLRNPEDIGGTQAYRRVLHEDLFGRDKAVKPGSKTP